MNWTKIADSEFHLKQNEVVLTTMKMDGSKAACRIGESNFQIRTKGFWGAQIELADASGEILTTLRPAGWVGSRWNFHLYGQDYQLVLRNNPLAEYAVQQNSRDIVAYGLKIQNGRAVAAVTDRRRRALYELDLLLWYLFSSVAQGETGDAATTDLTLLLSVA